jgi:hypothetical protein
MRIANNFLIWAHPSAFLRFLSLRPAGETWCPPPAPPACPGSRLSRDGWYGLIIGSESYIGKRIDTSLMLVLLNLGINDNVL